MTRTLARSSWALALPVALALASPLALADEGQKSAPDKTPGKTVTTTRSGNKVTREATVTHPDGRVRTSSDTWTKDGNTVTHEGETTLANGQKETRHSTTTTDGDTVTRDATRIGPNGGKTEAHSVRTKNGDAVTTQTTRTHTGPAEPRRAHHHHRAQHANDGTVEKNENAPKQ